MNTNLQAARGSDHNYQARYLILLGPGDESRKEARALLFGPDHRYLAEVIDDDNGLVVENLLRGGSPCPPPHEVARHDLLASRDDMQCYALG